jgi:hypothetical protein
MALAVFFVKCDTFGEMNKDGCMRTLVFSLVLFAVWTAVSFAAQGVSLPLHQQYPTHGAGHNQ